MHCHCLAEGLASIVSIYTLSDQQGKASLCFKIALRSLVGHRGQLLGLDVGVCDLLCSSSFLAADREPLLRCSYGLLHLEHGAARACRCRRC